MISQQDRGLAKRDKFTIEGDPANALDHRKGFVTYNGWTFGEYWNGWACPYFELGEAEKIRQNFKGKYFEKEDCFRFPSDLDEPENFSECDQYEGLDINTVEGKKHVYAVGAFGWIWENVE